MPTHSMPVQPDLSLTFDIFTIVGFLGFISFYQVAVGSFLLFSLTNLPIFHHMKFSHHYILIWKNDLYFFSQA